MMNAEHHKAIIGILFSLYTLVVLYYSFLENFELYYNTDKVLFDKSILSEGLWAQMFSSRMF